MMHEPKPLITAESMAVAVLRGDIGRRPCVGGSAAGAVRGRVEGDAAGGEGVAGEAMGPSKTVVWTCPLCGRKYEAAPEADAVFCNARSHRPAQPCDRVELPPSPDAVRATP